MRFRKDKGDDGSATQDTVETPALSRAAIGDSGPQSPAPGGPQSPAPGFAEAESPTEERPLDPPPPSAAERVEEPAGADATREAEGPAKVLPPPSGETRVDAPPPSAGERVEEPAAEPAKVLPPPTAGTLVDAPPPTAGTLVDAPPPSAAGRVESPAPAAGALVAAAPPTAAARVDAPPPQPGQLVSAAPPPGAATACPQCGTPAEAGQEMCIVCGSRIAREPFGAKRRGWLLPALAAGLGVLLLGTAAAFAVVELTGDDEVKKGDVADLNEDARPPSNPAPPADQAPPATTPQTTPAPTTPPTTPPEDLNPDPGTTTPSTPDDSGGGEIAEWPEGKTAYTVVLVSATSRNAADAKAEQAIKRGIEAGVLRSDDFSTLRAGYWVVFAGQYDTSEQATRAADRYAEQGFGGGYPRQVKPK